MIERCEVHKAKVVLSASNASPVRLAKVGSMCCHMAWSGCHMSDKRRNLLKEIAHFPNHESSSDLASGTGIDKHYFLRGGGRFYADAISVALSAKTGFMQLKNGSETRTDGQTDGRTRLLIYPVSSLTLPR